MKISIIHLTSVHPRYDTRIFLKMCSSLANIKEYNVNLIVADGNGNEIKNKVNIVDVGKLKGRISRVLKTTKRVLTKAIELDGDIYHLHDPELIPIGLKLKKLGKKVIFDSHEDVPKQILDREYLNPFVLKILSKSIYFYENYACKKYDAIVTATPNIRDKFLTINKNSVDINNYPIIDELVHNTVWEKKNNYVCYIGTIDIARGIFEIIKATELFNDGIKLKIAGRFSEESTFVKAKQINDWRKVDFLGYLSREEVVNLLKQSKVGLVTLHPISNYLDALPVKMFEYMASGIPVVASNFALWKDIIESNKCGICVDPLKPKEIADAVNYIISHPYESEEMGRNGKKAILKKYNWKKEEEKLFLLYKEVLGK